MFAFRHNPNRASERHAGARRTSRTLGLESLEGRQLLTALAPAADVLLAGRDLGPSTQVTPADVSLPPQAEAPSTLVRDGNAGLASLAAAGKDTGSGVAGAAEDQGMLIGRPDTETSSGLLEAGANADGFPTHRDLAQPAGKAFGLCEGGRFVFDSSTSGHRVTPEGTEQKFWDVELVRDPNYYACNPDGQCFGTLVAIAVPDDKDFIGDVRIDVVRGEDGSTSYSCVVIYGRPVRDGAGDPRDVDRNGRITGADFELIVQAINERASQRLAPASSQGPADGEAPLNSDVNGDGHVTPLDALLVANAIEDADTTVQPTSPWQNFWDPLDVNDDGFVTPLDALLVANELDRRTISDADGHIHAQRSTVGQAQPYLDVTGDQRVTAEDAALIHARLADIVLLPSDELESVLTDIAADVSQGL
jgi:hypothetical protein